MPKVFICYARADNEGSDPSERWLDRLLQQLAPLELSENVVIWSDQRIELGTEWHRRIEDRLADINIAILLLSPAFLASKYIRQYELPPILAKSQDGRITIVPIILRDCLYKETIFLFPDPVDGPGQLSLSAFQGVTAKPLNSLPTHEQDRILCKVASYIHDLVNNSNSNNNPVGAPQLADSAAFASSTTELNRNNLTAETRQTTVKTQHTSEVIDLWKEKLHAFLKAEAIASDPAQRFQLSKLIEEAKIKIQELEG